MRFSVAMLSVILLGSGHVVDAQPLARGHYAHMDMKLEKTWFGVDVARVDVWFDAKTRDRLGELVGGRRYSDELEERVARTILHADTVNIQLEFLRDVSMSKFLKSVRKNLEHARDAGYISDAMVSQSMRRVGDAFQKLSRRGFEDGDRLVYHARPGSLRTSVIADGKTIIDVTAEDDRARLAMLAGYFTPGSDFREPLIESLWD